MKNPPGIANSTGRLARALAVLLLLVPQAALAQAAGQNSLFSAAPTTGLIEQGPATGGQPFGPGGVLAPQPDWPLTSPRATAPTAPTAVPMVPAGKVALALSARFGKNAPQIDGGLTWRIYAAKADSTGQFRLIKE